MTDENPEILRLNRQAVVESALMDCKIWVARAADGEIGSVIVYIPFGKRIIGP